MMINLKNELLRKKRLPEAIKNKLYLASSLYIDYVVQRRTCYRKEQDPMRECADMFDV